MQNIIFTDGSSRGNPGRGGWGAVIVYNNSNLKVESVRSASSTDRFRVIELGGRESETTNNRMEMMAVIEALLYLSRLEIDFTKQKFVIHTDSAYVLNGATKWAKAWEKNEWQTKTGDAVLNKDLWEVILDLASSFHIEWKKVDGHHGVVGNERCDEIATALAQDKSTSLYDGLFESYSLDIYSLKKKHTKTTSKKNSGKAFSYVSKVNGKIHIDKTWDDCEKRVKGKSGVRYKKSLSKESERGIVAEFQ